MLKRFPFRSTSLLAVSLLVGSVGLGLVGCSEDATQQLAPASFHSHPAGAAHDRAYFDAIAILPVRDLGKTLAYYDKVLGFSHGWRWQNGGEFGGASRGYSSLMFRHDPKAAKASAGHHVMFFVTGVDELYQEHRAAGAKIVDPISDREWGFREYAIEDLNGYVLRIAESLPHEHDGQGMHRHGPQGHGPSAHGDWVGPR